MCKSDDKNIILEYNQQSADEHECRYIFTAVRNLNKPALKVVDVVEVVTLPYLDGEDMVVVFLGLPAEDVLSEECLGCLLEIVERMWRQGVEPI